MKGKYKTPEGQIVEVIDFDEPNKMAYIPLGGGQFKWYTEKEYTTWVKEGDEEVVAVEEVQPEPIQEEIIVEVPIEEPIVEEVQVVEEVKEAPVKKTKKKKTK